MFFRQQVVHENRVTVDVTHEELKEFILAKTGKELRGVITSIAFDDMEFCGEEEDQPFFSLTIDVEKQE